MYFAVKVQLVRLVEVQKFRPEDCEGVKLMEAESIWVSVSAKA